MIIIIGPCAGRLYCPFYYIIDFCVHMFLFQKDFKNKGLTVIACKQVCVWVNTVPRYTTVNIYFTSEKVFWNFFSLNFYKTLILATCTFPFKIYDIFMLHWLTSRNLQKVLCDKQNCCTCM